MNNNAELVRMLDRAERQAKRNALRDRDFVERFGLLIALAGCGIFWLAVGGVMG